MKATEQLKQMIEDRETELQIHYDLAMRQSILHENEIEYHELKLNEVKAHIEKIIQRAKEQGVEHIL